MVPMLQPREYFPIARVLPDPGDATTYYVQAVVRNARTNATIATVNLTGLSIQLFTGTWQVSADPSGKGLYITITSQVYTNSGYTTKSTLHATEQDTFVIFDRDSLAQSIASRLGSLGGDGIQVDYKKIRKIVQEEIKAAEKEETPLEKVDLSPVLSQIKALGPVLTYMQASLERLEAKETEETDLTPVHGSINAAVGVIKAHFDAKEYPEQKETDLSPVLSALARIDQAASVEETRRYLSEIPGVFQSLKQIQQSIKDILYVASSEKGRDMPIISPVQPKESINQFGVRTKR